MSISISNIVNYLSKYCPEGALVWDRLTAKDNDFFPTKGHIRLIQPYRIGLGYDVQGPDITITVDQLTINDYQKYLTNGEQAHGSLFDNTMNYLGILDTLMDLYSFLKPNQSVTIPQQMTLTFKIGSNDSIVIIPKEHPTLILNEGWTYTLSITKVTLVDGEATVDFDGSMLIKQRKYKI